MQRRTGALVDGYPRQSAAQDAAPSLVCAKREYEVNLSGGIGHYDGWDARDLYLYFTECTAPITIHNILLFYHPLQDNEVRQAMKDRVACYGPMMQGVHAIMGFTAPLSYPISTNPVLAFMKNWLSDGMSTAIR